MTSFDWDQFWSNMFTLLGWIVCVLIVVLISWSVYSGITVNTFEGYYLSGDLEHNPTIYAKYDWSNDVRVGQLKENQDFWQWAVDSNQVIHKKGK